MRQREDKLAMLRERMNKREAKMQTQTKFQETRAQRRAKLHILLRVICRMQRMVKRRWKEKQMMRIGLKALFSATDGSNSWKKNNWHFEGNGTAYSGNGSVTVESEKFVPMHLWTGLNDRNGTNKTVINYKKITVLSLKQHGLNGHIPEGISNMHTLQELCLSQNSSLSGHLPTALGVLVNLRIVNLSNNRLFINKLCNICLN